MSFKHMHHSLALGAVSALAIVAGCDNASSDTTTSSVEPAAGQGSFQIAVAPWEDDSQARAACYDIAVTGPDGASVWSAVNVCTDDFSLGDEGVLSYVGLCDASGTGVNTVTISLTSLTGENATDLSTWTKNNPPTYTTQFPCSVNADTVVRANFVVITAGQKGFLDVQVKVSEIACNAKIDCNADLVGDDVEDCTDDDTDGNSDTTCTPSAGTIVVALACQAPGADFTQLMLDDIALTCTDGDGLPIDVSIDGSTGVGVLAGYPNQYVTGTIAHAGVSADGTSFWTLQIGIQSGWTDCHLSTRMGANDGSDMGTNSAFPIIAATNIDFGFGDDGVFACDANPLDGAASGLFSTWGSDTDLDFDACLDVDGNVGICL